MTKNTKLLIGGSVGFIVGLHLLQDRHNISADNRNWAEKLIGLEDDTEVQKSIRSISELPIEFVNGLVSGIGFKTAIFVSIGTFIYFLIGTSKKKKVYSKQRDIFNKYGEQVGSYKRYREY